MNSVLLHNRRLVFALWVVPLFFVYTQAHAVTVVNTVTAQSVTGGLHAQAGTNGEDGKNGADGQDGKDGMSINKGNSFSSASLRSVINGTVVTDESSSTTSDRKSTVAMVEKKVATSTVDNSSVTVQGTAEGELLKGQTETNYSQIQKILSAIHLILVSYVSKLF